jgi:hypothetical protein
MLRRAIKANRITCHYDSEGEYAEPLREARPIIQRPIFNSTSFNNINLKLQQLVSNPLIAYIPFTGIGHNTRIHYLRACNLDLCAGTTPEMILCVSGMMNSMVARPGCPLPQPSPQVK